MRDAEAASVPQALIFEPFTLDIVRSALLRNGEVLLLRRQSYDVLRCLALAAGRVVSTDEIVDAVWSVRPAQPQESVTQCIKDIRRVMGDDARWMIRTISGTGYEFKPSVAFNPSASEGQSPAARRQRKAMILARFPGIPP